MNNRFFPRMEEAGGAAAAAGAAATSGAAGAAAAGAGAAGGSPTAGGAAAPTSWSTSFFKSDGTLDHAALEKIPEEFKGLVPTLSTLKTDKDLWGKLANLNSLAGRKALAPLGANATPEEVAAHNQVLRAVLGVPEKPDGYGFARPQDFPEEAWNDERAKKAMAIMHEGNVSPAVAQKLLALQLDGWKEDVAGQQKYVQEFYAQQDQAFREDLQKNGLDYDRTMSLIERVANQFGIAKDDVLLKNATVRNLMRQVGTAMGEHKFVGGESGASGIKSNRAMADDIVHNKQNPEYAAYWDASHAKHGEAVQKVQALYESATKEEQAAAGQRR